MTNNNSKYEIAKQKLRASPQSWLITGVAGFIGSNLLETLLRLNQHVTGLDNFATGHRDNLLDVKSLVSSSQWQLFNFIEGDIRDLETCHNACKNIEIVLHEAALGSVPRSIADPLNTNETNITGFLNMLVAARDAAIERFIYAASSSTYGDNPDLPKVEHKIGKPLSPYAVTKFVNELYAEVFGRNYSIKTIGLRYFNVFGPRQNPDGAYAAVIPKWFAGLINGTDVFINGDGETSRDFCFVDNCVQANLLAATTQNPEAFSEVYNVAFGERTSLNNLYASIRDILSESLPELAERQPRYQDFRAGDVRHTHADIDKAQKLLGYSPLISVQEGLQISAEWYRACSKKRSAEL